MISTKNTRLIKQELKKLIDYAGNKDESLDSIGMLALDLYLEYDELP